MRKGKQMMVAVVLLSAATAAMAVDRYVSPTGLHQNGYTNWTDAATNVQDAVNAAASGETIWVTNGHYICTSPVSVTEGAGSSLSMIWLNKTVTLQSVNGAGVTTLDAAGSADSQQRVIFVTAGNPTVDGFTITGGYINQADNSTWPHYRGGGVLRRTGGLTLKNCTVTENYSSGGGSGVALLFGGTVRDCVITNNTGTEGIHMRDGGGVYDSIITDNLPGGVYISNAGGRLERCVIKNNGWVVDRDNNSGEGGGVQCVNGGIVRNCLFTGNEGRYGGGVYIQFSAGVSVTVQNCTMTDNTAYRGGGFYSLAIGATANGGLLQNSISSGNSALDSGADGVVGGDGTLNASFNYSSFDFSPYGTGNIVGSNPQFVNAGAADYQIKRSSPCVDKGTNATWITSATVDLAGQTRRYWTHVDIGAYEFVPMGSIFIVR